MAYRRPRHGLFPSLKMKKMLAYESLIELDYMYLLEFDQKIVQYHPHPFKIEYVETTQSGGRKQRNYTPDFFVEFTDGRRVVVECKAEKYVGTESNQKKINIAKTWCAERDWEFVVVTDSDLASTYRVRNVKFLWRFARFQHDLANTLKIRQMWNHPTESLTVAELVVRMGNDPDSALRHIYASMYYGQLQFDIELAPIGFNTILSIRPL